MDSLVQAHFLDDIESTISEYVPSEHSSSLRSSSSECESLDFTIEESYYEPNEDSITFRVVDERKEEPAIKLQSEDKSTNDSSRHDKNNKSPCTRHRVFYVAASFLTLGFVVGVYLRHKKN